MLCWGACQGQTLFFFQQSLMGRDSHSLRAGRFWGSNPGGGDIFRTRPDRPGADPSFHSMGTGALSRALTNSPPQLAPRLKKRYNHTHPLYLRGILQTEFRHFLQDLGFGTLGSVYFSADRKLRTVQHYALCWNSSIFFDLSISDNWHGLYVEQSCVQQETTVALLSTWICEIEMIIVNVLSTVPEGMLQRAPTGRRF